MEYFTFRSQIKSGDLLIWSTHQEKGFKRIVNNIIRIFTMSEYSHVGIAWVINDRIFVIEAVRPVVRIYPLSKLIPFYCVQMDIDVNSINIDYLLSRVGEPYSLLQAIGSYFGKPKADKEWQCAELCSSFYSKCGIVLKNSWTPSTLVEAVLKIDDKKELLFITK